MRGVKSFGMLLAASDASHENVELLVPPEDSLPGERIWFGSEEDKETQPAAATPNQVHKKKIWEMVQPSLKTNDSCVAMFACSGRRLMRTSAGPVASTSLKNANYLLSFIRHRKRFVQVLYTILNVSIDLERLALAYYSLTLFYKCSLVNGHFL